MRDWDPEHIQVGPAQCQALGQSQKECPGEHLPLCPGLREHHLSERGAKGCELSKQRQFGVPLLVYPGMPFALFFFFFFVMRNT